MGISIFQSEESSPALQCLRGSLRGKGLWTQRRHTSTRVVNKPEAAQSDPVCAGIPEGIRALLSRCRLSSGSRAPRRALRSADAREASLSGKEAAPTQPWSQHWGASWRGRHNQPPSYASDLFLSELRPGLGTCSYFPETVPSLDPCPPRVPNLPSHPAQRSLRWAHP